MHRSTISVSRKTGKWKSSSAEKLAWLRRHYNASEGAEEHVIRMVEAGLLSKRTYWRDFRLDVYLEILEKERSDGRR